MIILDARGQATVEAALVVPLLLFLLAGIFVAGLWLNATLTVTAAAREGARAAALTGDCASVITNVKKTMDIVDTDPTGEHIHLHIIPDPLPNIGEDVIVRVGYTVPVLFGFFEKDYAASENEYPFGTAVGEATARMEVDPARDSSPCNGG